MVATTEAATQPLRLHRLEISNFMRVSALSVDADGRHVTISGPNGSGKTSSVEAIWAALKGSSTKDVPEPLHKGAAKASVKLDLGEYQVERRWTEKSTSLVVTASDGSRIAKPQQLLDGLLGKYSLDPVAFLERRPQDQVDDVLTLAGVEPPAAKVRELTGEDLPPRPGESADAYLLRLSADESGLFYVRRREAHRAAEQKRAALEEDRRRVDLLGGPAKPGEQPPSAAELLAEVERLQRKADERQAVLQAANDAAAEHKDKASRLDALRQQREGLARQKRGIEAQIAELTRQVRDVDAQAQALDGRIAKGEEIVAELQAEAHAAAAAVDALPDPRPKIYELRRQVADVEQANLRHVERAVFARRLESLAAEAEQATAEHRRLDEVLEGLRGLRAHLLDGIDLGVPGLEVGEGGLRLGGVPFRQASQAEQIRVACAVAMRQKPRLRLLRVDDGEHLDRKSRELLLKLADEHGWQVVYTMVADTEGLKVEIVEGQAS